MRIKVIDLIKESQTLFSAHAMSYCYKMMNLCLTSDPAAMLSFKVNCEGKLYNLDDIATVALPDDKHYLIYPTIKDFAPYIIKAMIKPHPEFKSEILEEDEKNPFRILVTVPDVDDDRHDLLLDAIDSLTKETETNMNLLNKKYLGRIMGVIPLTALEELNEAKDNLNQIQDYFKDLCDKQHKKKLEEVEIAYNEWKSKAKEKATAKQEKEAAAGEKVGLSMSLDFDDDE